MDDLLLRDGGLKLGVAVAERGDAETAGEVEVLAAGVVPDAAAFGSSPDHLPFGLPPSRRAIVSEAM